MKEKYLIPVYKRVGPVFVRGKGSWLWDEKGEKYLDLFPGWGVGILGHCHPDIARAISAQAARLIHLPNNLRNSLQDRLGREIVDSSFPAKVFFSNSGTEAIEGAIKFSRLYGSKSGRYEIITMKNSFHGRTMGGLSATGQKKYKNPFKPIVPGFKEAAFGDFADLKKKVTRKTVAVLLEPIQGEGGVNVAEKEYLRDLRKFCTAHDILLMADEVQTGMGRTAKMFCYQHYGIKPDVMLLAKGLGAGVPIGALVVKKSIADLLQPGHHASTFGGSPLVCAAAIEVFKIIKKERLLARAEKMGVYLINSLKKLQRRFPVIKEIRGKGLMVGVELHEPAEPFFRAALARKLIVNATHVNVLRIMPALTVSPAEIDKGVKILEGVIGNNDK